MPMWQFKMYCFPPSEDPPPPPPPPPPPFSKLNLTYKIWTCRKCGTFNWCDSRFHSYETDTQNSVDASVTTDDSVISVPSPARFAPTSFSSPTAESTTPSQVHSRVISQTFTSLSSFGSPCHATPAPLLAKSWNWRTLILNANSISSECA